MNNHKMRGFSFIELIMVIAIIGVLSGAGAWIMVYTVKNSVFVPNQLNMDKLANDALGVMIEGDAQARGLRFARVISGIAVNQVTFINQDDLAIMYRWDAGTNKLYRKIGAAAEAVVPAYASGLTGVTLSGKSGAIFTYYDTNEAVTATAANVRRIRMIIIAKTGTGLYNDWQGQSEQASSVTINRLQ
ncbi:MAG: prepilin-type N-terminal cleavage/methylation domain-containing protein [Candidatus Omnitrophica bacterium]|nr:prepilin-type N-terminal cleavage/methylation domain-containing protein [Candidatus Omnitrophota bacterium]